MTDVLHLCFILSYRTKWHNVPSDGLTILLFRFSFHLALKCRIQWLPGTYYLKNFYFWNFKFIYALFKGRNIKGRLQSSFHRRKFFKTLNHLKDCYIIYRIHPESLWGQVRAGAGEWRCMSSGIEFDCMGERTLTTLCRLMDAVRHSVRQRERRAECVVVTFWTNQYDSCMMVYCGLKVPVQTPRSEMNGFLFCLFVFVLRSAIWRGTNPTVCGKCVWRYGLNLGVYPCSHAGSLEWRGWGNLINWFLPALGRGALPVYARTHTVMVWESLVYAVPLALPSSERLVWKTRTHPPLPPQPLVRRLVSACGGGRLPAVWLPGGPGGSQATGWPCASAAGPWCSLAADGLCGSPWMLGQVGLGVALQQGPK